MVLNKRKRNRIKIYYRVSANRSQVVKQTLMFLDLFLGFERERKIHPPWNVVVRVSKLHILIVQITTKMFSSDTLGEWLLCPLNL